MKGGTIREVQRFRALIESRPVHREGGLCWVGISNLLVFDGSVGNWMWHDKEHFHVLMTQRLSKPSSFIFLQI
jgi:hypothetical protein